MRIDPKGTESGGTVVHLWLSIEPGDPPQGLIGGEDDEQGTAFCGWVDFMAVINTLRSPPSLGGAV